MLMRMRMRIGRCWCNDLLMVHAYGPGNQANSETVESMEYGYDVSGMIIGVALVVGDTTKGQRLYYSIRPGNDFVQFHEEFLSLSPDSFAKLFKPQHSMLNKLFDLVVEDVQYISFPMACQRDNKPGAASTSTISDHDGRTDYINMFNVVVAMVRESAMRRVRGVAQVCKPRHRAVSGEDPVAGIMGLGNACFGLSVATVCRVVERLSRALLHQEVSGAYVSKEAMQMVKAWEEAVAAVANRRSHQAGHGPHSPHGDESISSQGAGVTAGGGGGTTCGNDSGSTGHDSSDMMSGSLSHGTGCSNGIGPDRLSPSFSLNDDGSGLAGLSGKMEHYVRLMGVDLILQRSGLANELRSFYHCLVGGCCVCLTINGMLSLNIPLQDSHPQQTASHRAPLSSTPRMNAPRGPASDMGNTDRTSSKERGRIPAGLPHTSPIAGGRTDKSDSQAGMSSAHARARGWPLPNQTFLAIADLDTLAAVMRLFGCSVNTTVSSSQDSSPAATTTPSTVGVETVSSGRSLRARALACGIWNGEIDKDGSNWTPEQSHSEGRPEDVHRAHSNGATKVPPATVSTCSSPPGTSAPAGSTPTGFSWPESIVHHGAPNMWRILSTVSPLQSFAELRQTLGTSIEEINTTVAHLCQWGLGEIVSTITAHSLYAVHPDCPLNNETSADGALRAAGVRLANTFAASFGGGDINSVLLAFSGDAPLSEVLQRFPKHLQTNGLDILVWLLRRHVIVELHYFFFDPAVAMAKLSRAHPTPSTASEGIAITRQNPAQRPASSLYHSNRTVSRSHGRGNDVVDERAVRQKLQPYLDGRTPLCDILWLQDLTEEAVWTVVRKSPNIVVNIRHIIRPSYI